ncbi:MAG: N-acetylneuraminate lyase, partial [Plesiomonas shigelloides]
MEKLSGLIAAPHTPFDANGNVNFDSIDKIAAHLIRD